jgi:hypothetical protein
LKEKRHSVVLAPLEGVTGRRTECGTQTKKNLISHLVDCSRVFFWGNFTTLLLFCLCVNAVANAAHAQQIGILRIRRTRAHTRFDETLLGGRAGGQPALPQRRDAGGGPLQAAVRLDSRRGSWWEGDKRKTKRQTRSPSSIFMTRIIFHTCVCVFVVVYKPSTD